VSPLHVLKHIQSLALPDVGQGFSLPPPLTPWQWLLFCLISLRTKDKVSYASYHQLIAIAPSPQAMTQLAVQAIAAAIYPCAFYQRKAQQMQEIAQWLVHHGYDQPPNDKDLLLSLPGVGIKTVNLVLGRAYHVPSICVDVHVHRISNRLGWIKTNSPAETEQALQDLFDSQYWVEINDAMVKFGQNICVPVSPKCTLCPFVKDCPRHEVTKHR
jgi:endonuclease-3